MDLRNPTNSFVGGFKGTRGLFKEVVRKAKEEIGKMSEQDLKEVLTFPAYPDVDEEGDFYDFRKFPVWVDEYGIVRHISNYDLK